MSAFDALKPKASTPLVTSTRVIPVAGHDDMLLNLSGAHAPFFTRNAEASLSFSAIRCLAIR
jgi:hypothetical protein